MNFQLIFQPEAEGQLEQLRANPGQFTRYKAVLKALGHLQTNPRHPSLNTHKYHGLPAPNGQDMFEAYAQNRTPSAYRIFWHYGPKPAQLTICAITPHP